MQSAKEKLNNLLGISEDQTIDDFLDDLDVDANQVSSALSSIDDSVKETVQNLETNMAKLSVNLGESDLVTVSQVETNLAELKELIDTSKRVIQHVYESIVTSDLVDSELIQAMAKLIEATHINIADYIDIYKQKIAFFDKVKLLNLQYDRKETLLRLKYEYSEKLQKQKNSVDVPDGMVSFNFEDAAAHSNVN